MQRPPSDKDVLFSATLEDLQQLENGGLVAQVTGSTRIEDQVYYTILTWCWTEGALRMVGESQQRYSSFVSLQEQIGEGLGIGFTVPKNPFKDYVQVQSERIRRLSAYLNDALRACRSRAPPPELLAFLGVEVSLAPPDKCCACVARQLEAAGGGSPGKKPHADNLSGTVSVTSLAGEKPRLVAASRALMSTSSVRRGSRWRRQLGRSPTRPALG